MMDNLVTPEEKLKKYLSENGLKTTNQRNRILDIFIEQDRHMTPEEILDAVQPQVSSVGLATIYRTMKLLVKAGIAHERRFADGLLRYEIAVEGEHHDHIICIDCGKIVEFEDDIIEERQHKMAEENGFEIRSHRLDIYARCLSFPKCPNKQ
jgi:Fur family ferric uptake transcriptional regulator